MPQQQPGAYRGSDNDDEMSVSLLEETGAPGGNHRSTASNWQTATHTACAVPVPNPAHGGVNRFDSDVMWCE